VVPDNPIARAGLAFAADTGAGLLEQAWEHIQNPTPDPIRIAGQAYAMYAGPKESADRLAVAASDINIAEASGDSAAVDDAYERLTRSGLETGAATVGIASPLLARLKVPGRSPIGSMDAVGTPKLTGRTRSSSKLEADLRTLEQTEGSARVLKGIDEGKVDLQVSKKPLVSERTGEPVKGQMKGRKAMVARGLPADEAVTTAVHEGTHVMDVAEGKIPPPHRQSPADALHGEARAHKAAAAFAQANELTGSKAYGHARMDPSDLVQAIADVYGFEVTAAEIAAILAKVWGQK
jgi:hypothetical protein